MWAGRRSAPASQQPPAPCADDDVPVGADAPAELLRELGRAPSSGEGGCVGGVEAERVGASERRLEPLRDDLAGDRSGVEDEELLGAELPDPAGEGGSLIRVPEVVTGEVDGVEGPEREAVQVGEIEGRLDAGRAEVGGLPAVAGVDQPDVEARVLGTRGSSTGTSIRSSAPRTIAPKGPLPTRPA